MTIVSVAILHFGEISVTKSCLESLRELDLSGIKLHVIIINNDLRVEFPEVDKIGDLSVKVINNTTNTGFSGGHNQGFRFAVKNGSDFHVVLNNDVSVHKNLIKELINTFKRNPEAGIVSPKIYFSKGSEYHKDRYKKSELGRVIWYAGGITDWKNLINKHRGVDEVDHNQYEEEGTTDFATGACMMLPLSVIKEVGGFDEKYFLYYEDGDLNMRIKNKGYKIFFSPNAYMWHKNAASSSSGSTLQDYYITRNRMIFGAAYAPLRTKIALMRESIRILLNGREWQKKGIRDFYLRKFGKGSYQI